MKDQEFDTQIANLLNNRKLETSNDAWQRLEANLPKKRNKTSLFYWMTSAAAILILGLVWMFQFEKDNTITDVQPMIDLQDKKENLKSITPTKVVIVDSNAIQKPVLNNKIIRNQIVTKTAKPKNNFIATIEPKPDSPLNIQPIQPIQNESESADVDFNTLVMSKIKPNETQYTINPDDLLRLAESENDLKKDKNLKEKVIEKIKTTVNDIHIAFN